MVTAVRYELVLQSRVQEKVTELSRLVQQVCFVKHSYNDIAFWLLIKTGSSILLLMIMR